MRRHLGSALTGIHRRLVLADQILVESILHIRRAIASPEEARVVCFVLGKKKFRLSLRE
jgi:hypothetical protein